LTVKAGKRRARRGHEAARRESALNLDDYVTGVRSGNRSTLGRAITLIESRKPEHRALADALLLQLLPHSGGSVRVGITGIPGVGKSTFIDAFGMNLIEAGHRVAVLAVDPSSSRTGGSILGDKTRMARLSRDERAFIRPSPSTGSFGGVTRTTREAIILCEASGFDVILVETVGVGQSETAVADMVDFFLVLMIAGAGDELQGIKRGVLELADMIAVNKADGENRKRATKAASEYAAALNIMRPGNAVWRPPVLTCSALRNEGLRELWSKIADHRRIMTDAGELEQNRARQRVRWLWLIIEDRLLTGLKQDPRVSAIIRSVESDVFAGRLTPGIGADRVLSIIDDKVG
jgi:LAO/AO transport system kinase